MSYTADTTVTYSPHRIESTAIEEFCQTIGCSGVDCQCPGNPNCAIVVKVFPSPAAVSRKDA